MFSTTYKIINGHSLSNLGQGSFENGTTFVEYFPENFFKLCIVCDEECVDLTAGVVQVLARVVRGKSQTIWKFA